MQSVESDIVLTVGYLLYDSAYSCWKKYGFYRASNLLLRGFGKMSGEFVLIGLTKIIFPVEEIFIVDLVR